MTKDEISAQICAILEKDFDCPADKLRPEALLFEELDLDSIDAVDLIVRLQQLTGQKVDPASFKKIRTLADVTTAVDKLVNGDHA